MPTLDSSSITSQHTLIKSRWFGILIPMAVIGFILFLLMVLLMNLSYHSITNIAEREVEERLLESASKMAQQLSNELFYTEQLGATRLDADLDALALRLAQMSVPWNGYSLLMTAEGELLVFPYQAEDDWQAITWQAVNNKDLHSFFDTNQANFLAQASIVDYLEPLRLDASGLINLEVNNKGLIISWSSVTPTGWKLINISATDKAFLVKKKLKNDYRLTAFLSGLFLMITLFILFFLVTRRDQQLAINDSSDLLKEQALQTVVTELVVNEASFISLVDGPLMICSFDAAGLITACNSAFEHLAVSTQNNLKGCNLNKLLGLQSLMINPQLNEIELRIGQQEATSYWVSLHYAANGEGLLLLLDVSECKQIQQQLRSDKQRVRLAAKMKAEFFKVAVNDANDLLVELIQNARGFDANLTSYCQTKLLDVQHLLDDMRDMSDAGELDQQELSEDALVLNLLIDDCYTAANGLLVNTSRCLVIEHSANIPAQLLLDRRKLLRLMRHLLRQMIQLSTQGDLYLWIDWNGIDRLQLTLKDQGGGLAESERLRRFQLTTPMSSSYESASGALGLGQLLTRQLVHEMRGSLDVEALPMGGLQLQIELPARLIEDKLEHVAFGRILVIDDGPVNIMLASSVLEKSGYQVNVASSGAEALALGQDKTYDLVLMDIFMPDMDGLEATRLWRELPNANAAIPIVALTANTMEVERQRFLQEGMDDYLAKPYKPNELRELVLRWLQKK